MYAISNTKAFHLDEISNNFLKVATEYPVLIFLWCYVLTLLNYNDHGFWSEVTTLESAAMNRKILSTGSVILFCDYLVSPEFINARLCDDFLRIRIRLKSNSCRGFCTATLFESWNCVMKTQFRSLFRQYIATVALVKSSLIV